MFIGIDLGTSSIKTVLIDENQKLIGQSENYIELSNPKKGFYEQNPEDWFKSTLKCFNKLKNNYPKEYRSVQSIGISGQMHGATLIDKNNNILRPCILWNDTRSTSQCIEMQKKLPKLTKITGNIPMPGFTAPKILWIKENEKKIFKKIHKILLPKDYLRYKLTKTFFSDMSDASGTLWLDVKKRQWSDEMLNLVDLNLNHMPELVEGTEPTGFLTNKIKYQLGFEKNIILAGGAGDQAAGAIGSGVIHSHQSVISLGTSGVYFSPISKYSSNTNQAVHSFCHCIPNTWHHMSVMLSATNCLNWISKLNNIRIKEAIEKAENYFSKNFDIYATPFFLPYLTGERTPLNNPFIRGSFNNISTSTTIESMIYAVIEGISFGIKSGYDAVHHVSKESKDIYLIGGGSKNIFWGNLMASILNHDLLIGEESSLGSAFGAARLAMLSTKKYDVSNVITKMKIVKKCKKNKEKNILLLKRYKLWKEFVKSSNDLSKKYYIT